MAAGVSGGSQRTAGCSLGRGCPNLLSVAMTTENNARRKASISSYRLHQWRQGRNSRQEPWKNAMC